MANIREIEYNVSDIDYKNRKLFAISKLISLRIAENKIVY